MHACYQIYMMEFKKKFYLRCTFYISTLVSSYLCSMFIVMFVQGYV
ncbi:unnamed protein product [Linum tenue]|uniref:Uncharacterized protein n=1 Tax=Linum tenue TaxID=586396 RepID=A0AAV0LTN0_9ROSI|nr:unnamed protein product [Linum tenue]